MGRVRLMILKGEVKSLLLIATRLNLLGVILFSNGRLSSN